MNGPDTKGLLFVDESNINDAASGAYRALGAVLILAEHAEAIAAADATDKLRELKWNETSDGRHKRAALRVVDVIVRAEAGHLRIETLSWSKTDSRHAVVGRDDYANMERMLVHLTVNAMSNWRSVGSWDLNSDVLANVEPSLRQRTASRGRLRVGAVRSTHRFSARDRFARRRRLFDPVSSNRLRCC